MNYTRLLNIIFVIGMLFSLFTSCYAFWCAKEYKQGIKDYEQAKESLVLYNMNNLSKEDFSGVYGMAYGDKYFCIWAEDRSLTDVLDTCGHEWGHTHEGLMDSYDPRCNVTQDI